MKKEVIIFGASGDLGTIVSKVLLDKNYDKYHLFGRNFKFKEERKNVLYHEVTDLENEDNVKDAFKNLESDKNTVIYLFSSIGGFIKSDTVQNTELGDLNSMIDKNFITSFLIAKHFVNLVRKSKNGSICFVSSINASIPLVGNFAYGVSKNALNYLVKTLAKEGREYNFTANVIAPNILDTEKNREWAKDKSKIVSLTDIAELVHNIFQNHKSVSGNVFEMQGSIVD